MEPSSTTDSIRPSLREAETRSSGVVVPGTASERTCRFKVAREPLSTTLRGVVPAHEREICPGGLSFTTKDAPGVKLPAVTSAPEDGGAKISGS